MAISVETSRERESLIERFIADRSGDAQKRLFETLLEVARDNSSACEGRVAFLAEIKALSAFDWSLAALTAIEANNVEFISAMEKTVLSVEKMESFVNSPVFTEKKKLQESRDPKDVDAHANLWSLEDAKKVELAEEKRAREAPPCDGAWSPEPSRSTKDLGFRSILPFFYN